MLIAEQKEKENIVEYILYMWQMEDLLRGSNLDEEVVMRKVFSNDTAEEIRNEYSQWFANLILEMKESGVAQSGHVKTVRNYQQSLQNLHTSLLTTYQDQKYIKLYDNCKDDIVFLKKKSNSDSLDEIEVSLVGLYGLLLLRMSKTEISTDTEKAIASIGKMMAYLSESFKKSKNDSLNLPHQLKN